MNYKPIRILLFSLLSLLLGMTNGLAQKTAKDMYEKEWQIIDSLDQSGLPQSALEALNDLAEKVNPETEADQYLKIIFYRSKFITQTNEDGLIKAIKEIEAFEKTADFPIRPILQSILGQFYQSYLDAVIWEIQGRTTVETQPDDFRTWSVQDLSNKSTALFEASIKNKAELIASPITDFPQIIEKGKLTDGLRQTVYDVLAHRAIDNFTNEKNYLTQPAYQFAVDEQEVFENAAVFAELEWATQDTGSFKLKAIQILQELIQIHLNDETPEALIDIDLKRLKLMHQYSTLNNKDDLYLSALKKMEEKYAESQAAAEVTYFVAKHYYEKGANEAAEGDTANVWLYKEAFELCGSVIEKYPDSYGAKLCSNLRKTIQQASLSIEMERVSIPEQPVLVSVSYRNIGALHLKVVRLDDRDEEALRRRYDQDRMDYIFNLKPVQEKQYQLPDPGDFRTHHTEVKLDAMEEGRYAVLSSENSKFERENAITSITYIYVSRIGYFQRRGPEGAQQFVVMDRATGVPLNEVLAEFFISEYNSKKKGYDLIKIGEQYSDAQGMINAEVSPRNYWSVKFSKGKDVLYLNDNYRNYSRSRNLSRNYQTTQLFLDRSIYRPGQTVFFKGIILENDESALPEVVANKKVTLTFFDANNQQLDQQEFTTNDYGTFNGQFKTPSNVLLGRMRIRSDVGSGSTTFRVEEYKRPKFEVALKDLEKSYSLGEEVLVKGTAEGFAGNAIDGAVVSYRVYRTVRYPWLPWWIRMPNTGAPTEIANGTTKTSENGAFEFNFEALPDLNADRSRNPVFRYRVDVDVIDITGETHSDDRTFNLGYVGLEADVKIDDQLDKQQGSYSLQLTTTSLNGTFLPASGELIIHRLASPDRFFINRYWSEPDIYLMDKETYRTEFPYIAYDGEDKPYNWAKEAEQTTISFNTAKDKTTRLDVSEWPVGHYSLELKTNDEAGNELSRTYTFVVYDSETKKIPANIELWSKMVQSQLEPGDDMTYQLASSQKDQKVLLEIEHQNKLIRQEWLSVGKWKTIEEAVKEEYRGGFILYVTAMAHNRPITHTERLQVPWSNKKLSITYGTFRDKLRPGQQEEWQLKISGPEKEKVAAEMLVSMYDASLDQFVNHSWSFDPYPNFSYGALRWSPRHFQSIGSQMISNREYSPYESNMVRSYPALNLYGLQYIFYSRGRYYPSSYAASARSVERMEMTAPSAPPPPPAPVMEEMSITADPTVEEKSLADTVAEPDNEADESSKTEVVPRTNLNETVFFMPELRTDEDGNVIVSFTMNEALTRWKFMGLAHTKDLKIGMTQREIVTQKELMVLPNPPRFLRQGDELEITAKVTNLTDKVLNGKAELQFFAAGSMEPVNDELLVSTQEIDFTVEGGRSSRLAWELKIPEEMTTALVYRIIARSEEFSDGEENALPVLSNRIFITESMPVTVKGGESKVFELDRLEKVLNSKSATPHQLTMEITSNPSWLAIKALPYLMEYPHECTEQIFNRYYANSLATGIANAHPRVKEIFKKWENTAALESELMKNEALKSAILEETPWVMDAMAEEQQRKNMAILFDEERMNNELISTLNKLSERQSADGGFPWFPGGRNSRYITQLIVEGLGHLDYLGIGGNNEVREAEEILSGAIAFIDNALLEEYARLEKSVEKGWTTFEANNLSYLAIHYLYTRSFFQEAPIPAAATTAHKYYTAQAERYWLDQGFYQQGMIGLALHRMERPEVPGQIIASLKERSLRSDELGVYWNYGRSYWWYELPIETHSMLVELFAQVGDDPEMLDEMKIWLLRNKQTSSWETTKATAAAVFALLNQGQGVNHIAESWLAEGELVKITFPELKKKTYRDKLEAAEAKAEPGTGYYQLKWEKEEMVPGLNKVKIKNKNRGISWGGMYWQYFEDLDQVKSFEDTPLQLKKQIYKEEITDKGPLLTEIKEGNELKPGNKLIVRIELRVDRDMEFIHMKDMRGSGLEPLDVFSTYKWQDGLGYYQSTKDVATNFFFDYLPKGTYVFEYPLRVIHKGNYSSGITTIQSMYAPEFTSHSGSVRLKVK